MRSSNTYDSVFQPGFRQLFTECPKKWLEERFRMFKFHQMKINLKPNRGFVTWKRGWETLTYDIKKNREWAA